MNKPFSLLAALLCALFALAQAADAQQTETQSWVSVGDDGKLHYQATEHGDHIVDFSHAGYGGGGVKLPTVAVHKQVAPSRGDDSSTIQSAIDAVAAMPLTAGFRGAVLLKTGTFHCGAPLTISKDGIVLRGSGAGKNGTVIEMTGEPHICVSIAGGRLAGTEDPASTVAIADAYVPAGALGFSVKDAHGLAVGDGIVIRRMVTAPWIHFMHMDTLVRDGKPQTWMKSNSPITFERIIRAIEGSRITLDVPLPDAIDTTFLGPGAAVAVKVTPSKRLANCGIELLRIVSPPPSGTLSAINNTGATLENCEDCWIDGITTRDTLLDVGIGVQARRITLEAIQAIHTATVEKGAGYAADFLLRGSQVLIDRCSATGAGSFYVATVNPGATLNAVLHCDLSGNSSIQPHMHWSTALLIDSCHLPQGRIEFINRDTSGSGHGWAMGWAVAWNCTAKYFSIQQPPGAVNWCVGCSGEFEKGSAEKGPWLSSHGAAVLPPSLYLAQLRERLGEQALRNIGY